MVSNRLISLSLLHIKEAIAERLHAIDDMIRRRQSRCCAEIRSPRRMARAEHSAAAVSFTPGQGAKFKKPPPTIPEFPLPGPHHAHDVKMRTYNMMFFLRHAAYMSTGKGRFQDADEGTPQHWKPASTDAYRTRDV